MSVETKTLLPEDCLAHYGHAVTELGDDGGQYAVEGHVPERRARAIAMAYLRVDCGLLMDRRYDRDAFASVAEAKVRHQWVTVTDDTDEPWNWTDVKRTDSFPMTHVDAW